MLDVERKFEERSRVDESGVGRSEISRGLLNPFIDILLYGSDV